MIGNDDANAQMRDCVLEFLRKQITANVMGARSGSFENPLIVLPYAGSTKYMVDSTFVSTLWKLVVEGILLPGDSAYLRNSNNDSRKMWPYYTVTPFGLNVLQGRGDTVSPNDQSLYLAEARKRLPNADDSISLYLAEANAAFIARLYLSSVVMLGVSAEALSEWLFKSMRKHLSDDTAALSAFDREMAKLQFRSADRFRRLIKEINTHSNDLPRDARVRVESQFGMILNILKTYRDDVAHRRPFAVDPQLADGQLRLYLPALSVAAELVSALDEPCKS